MFRRFGFPILLLLSALLLSACSGQKDTASEKAAAAGGLTIDAKTLNSELTFIDVEQDGTAMQLIARRDDSGQIRLAFNTCQTCAGSPYAWFEDLGDGNLQCQNCGQTLPLDAVGTEKAHGCNPVTITDFKVDGDIVTVPQTLLRENVERFTNWKKFD